MVYEDMDVLDVLITKLLAAFEVVGALLPLHVSRGLCRAQNPSNFSDAML